MKVKKNDTVLILAGKDKGKTGKVVEAMPTEGKVKVEGINVQKRSKKARSTKEQSAIVEQIGAIDVSNVEVICQACGKATRVGKAIVDGKKVRVCKKCGASLETAKEVKTSKKAEEKPTTKKKTTKKAEGETAEKPARRTRKKAEDKAE